MNSLMRKLWQGLLGADNDITAVMREVPKKATCTENFTITYCGLLNGIHLTANTKH